jgi:glycosyltransferase involved in cell wall biosynthesis
MPGITTEVILLNHGRLEQELLNIDTNVTVIDEEKLNSIEILFQLVRILRKIKPDVIHTHRFKENILGACAAFFSGNIPSLRTTHGAPEQPPSWRQLPKRLIHRFDWFCGYFFQKKIISVSDDLTNLLKKNFPAEKIITIENGIDLEETGKYEKQNNIDSTAGNNTFRIGIAGRLVPIKRVDIFIKTARHILDHHPDMTISFHIFGDGPLRDELTKLSQKLKTDNIVHFEGHCDNMIQALLKLDALLMTSDHEGLPMILLEAMALQVPIIAHATGGIPNLLDQGSCGILVHKHDASKYGEEVNHLLTNPSIHTSIRKNALTRVTANYSAEQNARAYVKEYSLISRHNNV